jgi:hypothetical protein
MRFCYPKVTLGNKGCRDVTLLLRSTWSKPAATPRRAYQETRAYEYTEGLRAGYRWFDANEIGPQFSFGHGLSYTTFAFDDLAVAPRGGKDSGNGSYGGGVRVSLRVTNTGGRAGAAVPQVYLGFRYTWVFPRASAVHRAPSPPPERSGSTRDRAGASR